MEEMEINLKISRNLSQGNQIKSAASQTMIVKHAFEVEKIGPKKPKFPKMKLKYLLQKNIFHKIRCNNQYLFSLKVIVSVNQNTITLGLVKKIFFARGGIIVRKRSFKPLIIVIRVFNADSKIDVSWMSRHQ